MEPKNEGMICDALQRKPKVRANWNASIWRKRDSCAYCVRGEKANRSDIRKQSQIVRNINYSTLRKRQTKGTHEARKRSKFRRHYKEILRIATSVR